MLYHTHLCSFALYQSQKGFIVSVAKFCSCSLCTPCTIVHVHAKSVCPTLDCIPSCHLTVYDATRTYGKASARGCSGFLCMTVAVSLVLSHTHWQVVMTAFICSLGNLWSGSSDSFCKCKLLTLVIFLLVFQLFKIRLCAEGYALCNCLHYQM